MAGRYGGTMPKKRGKRKPEAKGKQIPAMKFLELVGKGTIWALKQVDKATSPTKPKQKEAVGGVNDAASGDGHPVLP